MAPRKSKNFHKSASKDESDGENQEDETLEYFIETFSGVIRLAEIYLKLANYGCLFFENFLAKVYCDMSNKRIVNQRQPCLVLSNLNKFFHNSDSVPPILNKADTLTGLTSLCSILEETFDIWCNYVSVLRDKYTCLNYFTISQIKYIYTHLNNLIIENSKDSKRAKLIEESFEFEIISSIMYNISSHLTVDKIVNAFKQTLTVVEEANTDSIEMENFTIKNEKNENFLEIKRDVYQQSFLGYYNQAWNDFIKEQNSLKLIKNKYLSFKQLIVLLDYLNKNEKTIGKKPHLNRRIPGYLNIKGNKII